MPSREEKHVAVEYRSNMEIGVEAVALDIDVRKSVNQSDASERAIDRHVGIPLKNRMSCIEV
jgi:hypothetical protein